MTPSTMTKARLPSLRASRAAHRVTPTQSVATTAAPARTTRFPGWPAAKMTEIWIISQIQTRTWYVATTRRKVSPTGTTAREPDKPVMAGSYSRAPTACPRKSGTDRRPTR
ncbi:MAG TPA: hypothetical protein VF246_01225 [Acidimicrobiia bacterium]